MITTTSSSKPYIYLKKNSILVVHSQLASQVGKQTISCLREIELYARYYVMKYKYFH